jgi:hypothetical protein
VKSEQASARYQGSGRGSINAARLLRAEFTCVLTGHATMQSAE